jgi:hypothetical protein
VARFAARDIGCHGEYEYRLRRVIRLIERTIDKHRQKLPIQDIWIE